MRYLLALLVLMTFSAAFAPSKAQVRVSVNFNLNSQPEWGPSGYDYAEYYYLPDIDVYYSVPRHAYFFYDRGRWVSRTYLPARFRGYDLYRGYKVVINEREPWRRHDFYKSRYMTYRNRYDQCCIRDNRGGGHKHRDNDGYYDRHDNGKHKGWHKNGKAYDKKRQYDYDDRGDHRDRGDHKDYRDHRDEDRLGRW